VTIVGGQLNDACSLYPTQRCVFLHAQPCFNSATLYTCTTGAGGCTVSAICVSGGGHWTFGARTNLPTIMLKSRERLGGSRAEPQRLAVDLRKKEIPAKANGRHDKPASGGDRLPCV
jgi:hypothetical protein